MSPWRILIYLPLQQLFFLQVSSEVPSSRPAYLDSESFVRRRYHSSAKLGSHIYIDGGDVAWRLSNGTVQESPSPKTLSIDMSTSWNASSVELKEIERGNAPLLNQRALWVDETQSTIYAFGGEISWLSYDTPQRPLPWKFSADGQGGGSWIQENIKSDSNFPSVQPASGCYTYGNNAGYYLGGHLIGKTFPATKTFVPVSNLITYNMTSNTWKNVSSTNADNGMVSHYGISQFVPSFGPSGLILFMGGELSSTSEISYTDEERPFTSIVIYEPESERWFQQNTTGTIPTVRNRACAVGVQGNNNTYEIFIYGGTTFDLYGGATPSASKQAELNALDEVFVLTLPAFVWFKANYSAKASRQSHTCHLVGNRQLLSIGGIDPSFQEEAAFKDPNAVDNFKQGLGIFDLTEMKWSDGYNAEAASYESPNVVSEHYRISNQRYPSQWGYPELAKFFGDPSSTIYSSTPSPTIQSGNGVGSNDTSTKMPQDVGKNHAPLIAGTVLGSVALITTLYFLIRRLYLRRQRKETSVNPNVELDSQEFGELYEEHKVELANGYRAELPAEQSWELPAPPRIPTIRIMPASPAQSNRRLSV